VADHVGGRVVGLQRASPREATGQPQDIPAQQLSVSGLPLPPAGTEIRRVDIIVRICPGGVD